MKFTSIKDLGDYVLVLLDNGDLEYCKYADELIVEKTMRFPTYDGLAYAPSFLDATNEYTGYFIFI